MNKVTLLYICAGLTLHVVAHAAPDKGVQQADVFVGGTDGYHTYRIPSLIVTKEKTLLAFCEGRKDSRSDTGDIDVLVKRSTDGGGTWGPQRVIWDDGANTCGNPCAVVDEKTGVIWLLLTHNLGADKEADIKAKASRGSRTVWVTRSDDDGMTWTKPVEITGATKKPEWGWYATGPGVGIQIKNGPHKGRLVIPCDHSYPGEKSFRGSHIIYSDDHGESWQLGGVIRPQMNECQAVELADGKGTLLMDMRSYFGRSRRGHSVSSDGGETWSDPVDHPELIEPVCQASILRHTWPGGGESSRILFSNPADEKRRRNMTVRLSYDEGKTWPVAKTLHQSWAAYSCLTVLPDQSIGCLYERGVDHAVEMITFARFSLDWLSDGNDSVGQSKMATQPVRGGALP